MALSGKRNAFKAKRGGAGEVLPPGRRSGAGRTADSANGECRRPQGRQKCPRGQEGGTGGREGRAESAKRRTRAAGGARRRDCGRARQGRTRPARTRLASRAKSGEGRPLCRPQIQIEAQVTEVSHGRSPSGCTSAPSCSAAGQHPYRRVALSRPHWPDMNFNFAHIKQSIQALERAKFDAFFMADHMRRCSTCRWMHGSSAATPRPTFEAVHACCRRSHK